MNIDITLAFNKADLDPSILEHDAEKFFNSGHYATHIDTHLKTKIPVDYMDCRALMFDVSAVQDRDIELSDFEATQICAQDCVIFKTDMIKRHPYGSKTYFLDHPQLSDQVIDFMIDKSVHIIGIDAAGIRRGDEHVIADKRCEANGIYIVENLTHLDQLNHVKQPFAVTLLWIEVPGRTGLPCRVIARVA